jgi:hypothetical protein
MIFLRIRLSLCDILLFKKSQRKISVSVLQYIAKSTVHFRHQNVQIQQKFMFHLKVIVFIHWRQLFFAIKY